VAEAGDSPGPEIDLKAVALALLHRGKSVREVAELIGRSKTTVYDWQNQAYEEGLMGKLPRPYEFATRLDCTCEDDPLRPGELIVCVNCCSSGWDFHPGLHAQPLPKDRRHRREKLKGGSGGGPASE
jgi:hypothetical protein